MSMHPGAEKCRVAQSLEWRLLYFQGKATIRQSTIGVGRARELKRKLKRPGGV